MMFHLNFSASSCPTCWLVSPVKPKKIQVVMYTSRLEITVKPYLTEVSSVLVFSSSSKSFDMINKSKVRTYL